MENRCQMSFALWNQIELNGNCCLFSMQIDLLCKTLRLYKTPTTYTMLSGFEKVAVRQNLVKEIEISIEIGGWLETEQRQFAFSPLNCNQ